MNNVGRVIFPLVIIGALAWLAFSTLGTGDDGKQKYTFSQVLNQARQKPPVFKLVTFHPKTQEIEVEYLNGGKATVAYPVDQSAFEFQQMLEKNGVLFDSKRTGESPWSSILTSLLPFVLLFGFWIFLMRNVQSRGLTRRRPDPDSSSTWR